MARFTKSPQGVYLANNCTITGEVKIGECSSVWFGAVIRGDVAPVIIGKRVNVQDNVVIHCDTGVPNVLEDDIVIGHGAIVHGKFVGAGSMIGMGATVLSRTVIGRGCLIAAGALATPDMQVPDGMVVMGVPGKIVRPVNEEEKRYMSWLIGHYQELAEKYVAGMFG